MLSVALPRSGQLPLARNLTYRGTCGELGDRPFVDFVDDYVADPCSSVAQDPQQGAVGGEDYGAHDRLMLCTGCLHSCQNGEPHQTGHHVGVIFGILLRSASQRLESDTYESNALLGELPVTRHLEWNTMLQ